MILLRLSYFSMNLSSPIQFAMIGKNSHVPDNYVIEGGALIYPDVAPSDYPSNHISSDAIIESKREPYEV